MTDHGNDPETSATTDAPAKTLGAEKTERPPLRKRPLISSEIDLHDPTYRNNRVAIELFRSISIGKMIAVVGSGATIPYGYDSWDTFCDNLLKYLNEICNKISTPPEKPLISKSAQEYYLKQYPAQTSFDDLKSQEKLDVFSSFYPYLTKYGKKTLRKKYKKWFFPRKRIESNDQDVTDFFKEHTSVPMKGCLPSDLSRALDLYCKQVEKPLFKKRRLKTPIERISSSRNIVDPLKTLRSALRINRFATFNYDLEIETMLEDLDYPYDTLTKKNKKTIHSTQSRLGASARSISLSPNNASELISIAAMPSSDDALVVHLHGAVTRPGDMVVTQHDYNALYIHDNQGHQSFEDARRLMFGGNAILYVGVGLGEEDLLRPLRYLKSEYPDRPIYALAPSLVSVTKDKAFAAKIKANYDVNVITYGWDSATIEKEWLIEPPTHELDSPFIALHEELENVRIGLRALLRGEAVDIDRHFLKEKAPRLNKHPDFIFILKSLQRTIEEEIKNQNEKDTGIAKGVAIAFFLQVVESIAMNLPPGSEQPSASIDLEDEQRLIISTIRTSGIDPALIKNILDKKSAPRLNKNPIYIAALNVLEQFSKQIRNRNDEDEFIEFFESVIIGTALNMVLNYLADATRIWRTCWRISERINSKKWDLMVLQSSRQSHLSENDNTQCSLIFEAIENDRKMVSAVYFKSGSRKGAFVTYINQLRDKCEKWDIRIYCLDNSIAPNSLLSNIFNFNDDALQEKKPRMIFINNADRLLDIKSKKTKNLLVEKILKSLADIKIDRVVFVTGKQYAADFFRKFFYTQVEHSVIPVGNLRMRGQLEQHEALRDATSVYRWPNKVIEGMVSTVKRMYVAASVAPPIGNFNAGEVRKNEKARRLEEFRKNTDSFLRLCNNLLESRASNSDPDLYRAIFCGAMLDAHHLWVREHGTADDRLCVVVQHTTLKWMFAIHIPIDNLSIESLNEVQHIAESYGKSAEIGRIVDDALKALAKFGLIYRVSNEYGEPDRHERRTRYILHSKARSYLAHKRGLSYGWMEHREWNTVTLCNAIAEGGPLFNRDDYHSVCKQIDEFIENYHRTGGDSKHDLRCAYALIRGHFYSHNAIRAGMVFLPQQHPLSVLEDHVGRISRLRSACSLLAVNSRPHFYESFEVWVLNEIAALRYMQGDFHDCVMLFREVLNFFEKNPSVDEDPALVPRLRINLALSLVERARFDEALEILDAVHAALDGFVAEPHPESLLLCAMAFGCQAQIELLTAKLDRARDSIRKSLVNIDAVDVLGVRGWLRGIAFQIASASGDIKTARSELGSALAAAHGSLRPDLIMNLEIAKAEFEMRDSNGNRETAIAALANLNEIEKSARVLGSQKACVSILLIRARVLLYMGQVDTARDATLDAICKSLLNGMRLKRITGLILMSAIMAMRGEIVPAKDLLNSTRLTAMKMRYIRAVLDIDRLRHAIDIEGGVSQWAGYLSEFDVSPSRSEHI